MLRALKQRAHGLKRDTYALIYAYRDPRLPWYARIFAAYVVARTFSPIDLIPDFIPILGYLDDLILTPLGIALALKMIPPEIWAEARQKADNSLENQHPINRAYIVLVVLVWLLILVALARAFLG